MHPAMSQSLEVFVTKWAAACAAERANKDSFLNELCDVLEVPRPNPTSGDADKNTYVFERDAKLVHEDGLHRSTGSRSVQARGQGHA